MIVLSNTQKLIPIHLEHSCVESPPHIEARQEIMAAFENPIHFPENSLSRSLRASLQELSRHQERAVHMHVSLLCEASPTV